MYNSDQPAMPISSEQTYSLSICITESTGLTKREYFAGLAMQGLLSNPNIDCVDSILAKSSVEISDALLKQLEED